MKKILLSGLIFLFGLGITMPVFAEQNAIPANTDGTAPVYISQSPNPDGTAPILTPSQNPNPAGNVLYFTLIQHLKNYVNVQVIETNTGVQINLSSTDPSINEKLTNIYYDNYFNRGTYGFDGNVVISGGLIDNGFALNIDSSDPQVIAKIQDEFKTSDYNPKVISYVEDLLAQHGMVK